MYVRSKKTVLVKFVRDPIETGVLVCGEGPIVCRFLVCMGSYCMEVLLLLFVREGT